MADQPARAADITDRAERPGDGEATLFTEQAAREVEPGGNRRAGADSADQPIEMSLLVRARQRAGCLQDVGEME